MSVDQVHHTVIGVALKNEPDIRALYQRLYPDQGKAFGFTADFSRKLTSAEYRDAYAKGETRALLRLPSSGNTLPATPNASTH